MLMRSLIMLSLCMLCTVTVGEEQVVTMNAAEKEFRDLLNGSLLTGSFTMKGKHEQDGLAPETYEISKLDKMKDGKWRFMVRIKYLKTDITVPLFLEVKWVEKTPVIYVEKIMVPGAGTYSSRVIFHGKRYAGTWDGDGYGGHLFGTVQPLPVKSAKPKTVETKQQEQP